MISMRVRKVAFKAINPALKVWGLSKFDLVPRGGGKAGVFAKSMTTDCHVVSKDGSWILVGSCQDLTQQEVRAVQCFQIPSYVTFFVIVVFGAGEGASDARCRHLGNAIRLRQGVVGEGRVYTFRLRDFRSSMLFHSIFES